MRIGVDMPEPDLKEIDWIAALQHRSRDEVVLDAIMRYVADYRDFAFKDAFGLWGDHDMDSVSP